jgi:Outer membrane lipoprotein
VTEARLSESGSERERALLLLGSQEEPTAESVRAAARVLGLVPRAAIATFAFGVFARAVKWSSPGASLVVPAVVAAGVIASAYVLAERHAVSGVGAAPVSTRASTWARPSAAASTAVLPAAPAASSDARPDEASLSTASRPARPESVPAVARAARGSGPVPDDVRAQVGLVDRARALLNAGDQSGALRLVDSYGRRFPRGVLAEEASMLRVQAVYARGDHAAAAALVQRFVTEYPRSVYADKIQWMLSDRPN